MVAASTIVRCKRCRAYINPFVTFQDQGVRWRCNICFSINDGTPCRRVVVGAMPLRQAGCELTPDKA